MYNDLNLTAAYIKHPAIVLLILVSVVLWLYLPRRLSQPAPGRSKVWSWVVVPSRAQAAPGVIILFLSGRLAQ
jgi:hypothetical protein